MKRLILILNLFLLSFLFFGINLVSAGADTPINTYVNPLGDRFKVDNSSPLTAVPNVVGGIANSLITKAMGIIGIIVLCMFVWSGLKYIMANGDSKKVGDANNIMKWSVIGLAVVFASYIIINFVFTVIGSLK